MSSNRPHPSGSKRPTPSQDGVSLRDSMALGPLSEGDLYALARGVAESLARAHERGLAAGNLSQDSVWRRRDGNFVCHPAKKADAATIANDVLRFGALLVTATDSPPTWLTRILERCEASHADSFRRGADIVAALLPHAHRFATSSSLPPADARSFELVSRPAAAPSRLRHWTMLGATIASLALAAIVREMTANSSDSSDDDQAWVATTRATNVSGTTDAAATKKSRKKKSERVAAPAADAIPDTAAPVVTFTAMDGSPLAERVTTESSSFLFMMAATDDRDVVSATQRLRLPGHPPRTEAVSAIALRGGTTIEVPLAETGDHVLELEVRDAAGNTTIGTLVVERR